MADSAPRISKRSRRDGRACSTLAYIRNDGADFIGWTDVGGQYSAGTRPLPNGTKLLDLRASRTIAVGRLGRIELILDVLNALNDTAEEGLATDNLFAAGASFGQPTVFMDPRRAVISVRVKLGR